MVRSLVLLGVLALGMHQAKGMGPFGADSLAMAALAPLEAGMPDTGLASVADAGENRRAMAIALAVLLGPFGAHRLYLGTTPKVAIAYGLTFGGFGVVALIDLVHLIAVKDLSRFQGSGSILMWVGGPTPP